VPRTVDRDSVGQGQERAHIADLGAIALLCPPSWTKIASLALSLSQRCNDTVTTASHERATVRANAARKEKYRCVILIVTDAWSPQVNGVVTTVSNTVRELKLLHHDVGLITPDGFRTLPCPTDPEIRLAIAPGPRVCG
jgi:hypothetical protein